jgi:hypothetical protein
MSNPKAIGNAEERRFAYALSEWITGDKDADICWRDMSSGARNTSRKKQGKETQLKADIVCTSSDPKHFEFFNLFYVDTKCYKKINFVFIDPKNQKSNGIFNQWKKTVDECSENMIPVMPCNIRDRVTSKFILFPSFIKFTDKCNTIEYSFTDENKKYDCLLVLEDEFFKVNNWYDFVVFNKKEVI